VTATAWTEEFDEGDLEPGPPAVPSARYTVLNIDFHGGQLCLDFTNTAVWRLAAQPEETLVDYPALLAWSRRAGTVDQREAELLHRAAEARPDEAAAVLARAIALREAIYLVLVATIGGRTPRPEDLAFLNVELAEAMTRATVRPNGAGFSWDWPAGASIAFPSEPPLARPLWSIARSAAELLVSPELARVKRCPGTNCGWLFLDTSKNASRRWCHMAICGNRARVRAFAARKRAKGGPFSDA
jgi:predicted RNA-binding Zn ribbon-like protein